MVVKWQFRSKHWDFSCLMSINKCQCLGNRSVRFTWSTLKDFSRGSRFDGLVVPVAHQLISKNRYSKSPPLTLVLTQHSPHSELFLPHFQPQGPQGNKAQSEKLITDMLCHWLFAVGLKLISSLSILIVFYFLAGNMTAHMEISTQSCELIFTSQYFGMD